MTLGIGVSKLEIPEHGVLMNGVSTLTKEKRDSLLLYVSRYKQKWTTGNVEEGLIRIES